MQTPITRIERIAAYFVLVAMIVIVVMVLRPGFEQLTSDAVVVHVIADDAAHLGRGDEISMRGLQIGEIRAIDLLDLRRLKGTMAEVVRALGARGTHKVMITCEVYSQYADKITRDVTFTVQPPALLGSGRVVVESGDGTGWLASLEESGGGAPRGPDEVRSGDYVLAGATGSLTDNANRLVERATALVDNANDQVTRFGATLTTLENSVTKTLGDLEGRVSAMLGVVEGDIGSTLGGVDRNLDEAVVALRGSLTGIDGVVALLTTGEGSLAMLLNTPDLHRDLDELLSQVQRVIAEIDAPGLVANIRAPVVETLSKLPPSADRLYDSLVHLQASLGTLEKGLEPLPPATASLVATLEDLRKIVESVKRLGLIESNLPADAASRTTAPINPRRTGGP